MKRIIYTRPDGGVSVVTPCLNIRGDEGLTEQDALNRALARIPKDAINTKVVDESAIPTDRTFRNGWAQNGARIGHDMNKCREIHRNGIRATRKPLLEQLDAEWMKAMGRSDAAKAAEVEAKRQALRDAPADPLIDAATTPEELKVAIPRALKP